MRRIPVLYVPAEVNEQFVRISEGKGLSADTLTAISVINLLERGGGYFAPVPQTRQEKPVGGSSITGVRIPLDLALQVEQTVGRNNVTAFTRAAIHAFVNDPAAQALIPDAPVTPTRRRTADLGLTRPGFTTGPAVVTAA